jgi:hypothetical protein
VRVSTTGLTGVRCPECGHGIGYHYGEGCFYGHSDIRDLSSPICGCQLSKSDIEAALDAEDV